MPGVFEPTILNGLQLSNRLVRSATWEGLADAQGGVTDALVSFYEELAAGEVGLIISSYMSVRADGAQLPGQLAASRDELVPGLRRMADAVHRNGGVIAGQIVHCGGQAERSQIGGQRPVAPSAVESPGYSEVPRELTDAEIPDLVACFAQAARRLKDAGFDAVQLHGAHGYLLSQFLSPQRNLRAAPYGGSLENRARFALEVFQAVRAAVGPEFPVTIKLNAHDYLDGSTTEKDSTYLAAALADAGIDAIEVSAGTPGSGKQGPARAGIRTTADEAYFLPLARKIREAAPDVPLFLVGGIRSLETIEALLAAGDVDCVSLARPLLREPGLPKRWRSGDRTRAACISCSRCFEPGLRGEGVHCVQEEELAAGRA